MTTSRDTILNRIHHALTHPHTHPTSTNPPSNNPPSSHHTTPETDYQQTITRTYLTTHAQRTPEQTAELLAHNLADYRAHVHHTTPTGLPTLIAQLLTHHGTHRVLIPDGLPHTWLTQLPTTNATPIPDNPHTTHHDLDTIDSVITTCTIAIAETGTIVLDHTPGQGHRRTTLIPDHHICIITPDNIVPSLPHALPRLNPTHPQTWISGPSATSDIELDRVEGVHGPRTLDTILVSAE